MPRYMLDTDVSSYLIRGDHPEVLEQLRKHLDDVCISCITEAELQYGAMKRNSRRLSQKVNLFCDLIPCIDWTQSTAKVYAGLRTELEAQGTPIGSMDMMIAASALAEDVTLVTNNMTHFSKIRGLKLENWVSNA